VPRPGPHDVVPDEHLAARRGASADPDRRHAELLRDVLGELPRDGLEDDRERAGGLHGARVADERGGAVRIARLDAVAGERDVALGQEADVAHDGDADLGEAADGARDLGAALELDGLDGAALAEDAHGGAHGVGRAGVVRAEGHVGDEQRRARAARDGAAVVQHLVERERGGGGEAEADLRERVADERHVRVVRVAREPGRVVVRGEHHDRRARAAHGVQLGDRHFLPRLRWADGGPFGTADEEGELLTRRGGAGARGLFSGAHAHPSVGRRRGGDPSGSASAGQHRRARRRQRADQEGWYGVAGS
jgi:hypothetical protein